MPKNVMLSAAEMEELDRFYSLPYEWKRLTKPKLNPCRAYRKTGTR